MKRILAAAFLFIAIPTGAQVLDPEAAGFCDRHHALAKAIMNGRQLGLPMKDVMEMSEKYDGEERRDMKTVVQRTIIAAYEIPRFRSDEFREQATADFTNDQYLLCVKTLQD